VTVRRNEDGTIILDGPSASEDAEALARMLEATPEAPVDWTQCHQLHTAVLQVILAVRPVLVGACGDVWVRQWVEVKGS
jgi:hypothetical protein